MDLKRAGNKIALIQLASGSDALELLPKVHRAMAEAIRRGLVLSCHDVSDGGTLVAAAEMCVASGLGMDFGFDRVAHVFSEDVGTYVIEHEDGASEELDKLVSSCGAELDHRGVVLAEPRLRTQVWEGGEACEWTVDEMAKAWRGTLDW